MDEGILCPLTSRKMRSMVVSLRGPCSTSSSRNGTQEKLDARNVTISPPYRVSVAVKTPMSLASLHASSGPRKFISRIGEGRKVGAVGKQLKLPPVEY